MAMTADELAKSFHPRPRGCTQGEDWQLARKDAAKAIELLDTPVRAAALKLLDCLVPGIILTIGGVEIDHSGINDAKAELEAALK